MRSKHLLLSVFCYFIICTSVRAQDDAAIKQVVTDETAANFKGDSAAWASAWLQEPSVSRTFVGIGTFAQSKGWDSIYAREMRNFKQNAGPVEVQTSTDSFTIRKDGKLAVVDYRQKLSFTKAQAPFDKFDTWEHRVLVKKNGKWKIAEQVTTNAESLTNPSELTLNAVGYGYLFAGKVDEAIQVLELNTKLYPDSYNVFDSLGEAYAKAGKKDQAIQNYEKSLQMNPKNTNAADVLKTLK